MYFFIDGFEDVAGFIKKNDYGGPAPFIGLTNREPSDIVFGYEENYSYCVV